MMKHEPHGRNRIRLLAMYHLQLGKSFKAISEIVKSHWKTVQSWLRRFRNHGFEGLFESQRSGAPRKINTIQESALFDKINTLSKSKTGGYITGKELHIMLLEEYGAKCALKTVYNTMCTALVLAGLLLVQCIQSQIKRLKIDIKKLSRHVNKIISKKYR
ncbi:helix-turn-helix domain-containing protein [Candidatus Tisiphia endosymbiont of Neophilaenus lineatus]|uniref:helix-turn-helix domain-containing protein n=1 Tax=Candidatus Tisiphia endosymbiont of Neophilaenus lineatus TaxID=3139336 RepID=UPI0035CB7099